MFEDYAVLPVEPEANDGLIVKYEHVVDQQCVDGEAELKGDEGVRREYQFFGWMGTDYRKRTSVVSRTGGGGWRDIRLRRREGWSKI